MNRRDLVNYAASSRDCPTESERTAAGEADAAHAGNCERAEMLAEISAPLRLTQDMLSRFTAAELHEHAAILRADLAAVQRQLAGRGMIPRKAIR